MAKRVYTPPPDLSFRFRPASYPEYDLKVPIVDEAWQAYTAEQLYGGMRLANLVLRTVIDKTAPHRPLDWLRGPARRTKVLKYLRAGHLALDVQFGLRDDRYPSYSVCLDIDKARVDMRASGTGVPNWQTPQLLWLKDPNEDHYALASMRYHPYTSMPSPINPLSNPEAAAPEDKPVLRTLRMLGSIEEQLAHGLAIDLFTSVRVTAARERPLML